MVTRPPITGVHVATHATLATATPAPPQPPAAPAPVDLPDDRIAGAGFSGALPALLLPLRIETRWFASAADALELRVRVFPDVIHVAEERAELSAAEVALARRFIDAADAPLRRAAWDEAVNALGAPRAAYAILRVRDGASAVAEPAEGVSAAHALPSRLALVLEGTGFRRVAWGSDIPSPLPAGIAAPDAPATRWQFDFDAAEAAGLGWRVPFASAQAQALSRIFAVGLRDGTPAEQAHALGALLGRQFAGPGSELLAAGTPTNNTDDTRSGFDSASRADAQAAAIQALAEPLAADADGTRLAQALGLGEPLMRPLAGARTRSESEAALLHAALWPGTAGPWLAQLMDPAVPAAAQDFMRRLFVDEVRARGPLPVLRIGRQPYGVLPATSLNRWRASGDSAHAAHVLRSLRQHWAAQAKPPSLHRGGDENVLRAALAQGPLSRRLALRRARPAEAGYAAATLAALERAWTAVEPALRALGLTQRPALSRFVHDPTAHWTRLALVAPPGAPHTQPLVANYLRALAAPANATALRSHQAAGGAAPATLLYLLVRAGFLEIALALVKQLFGVTRVTVRDHRDGTVVTRIERPWRLLTRAHARLNNQSIAAAMARVPNRLELLGAVGRQTEWVQLTAPVRALRAALSGIAELPVQRLEDGLLEALDALSYRLDAWVTALATRRLREQRRANPEGLHLGGWGFVGAPPLPPAGVAVQPARSDGFEFAPSLAHARSAALLRSGFEARRDDAPPPAGGLADTELAVDLASARMRGAVELVQLARAGCSVGEALGRRLERWLVEQGLGTHTPALRERAPLDGGRIGIDGVKLAEQWQRAAPVAPLDAAARQLVAWVDALGDLMLAEGLHQLAGGRRERARAVIEAIERGEVLPEHFDVLAGPAGAGVRPWRLDFALPTAGAWPGSAASVRAAAAPALEALAAAWLGTPKALKWTATGRSRTGRAKKVVLDVQKAGLCALDLVALARRGDALQALVRDAAHARGLATVDALLPAPALAGALAVARWLARLFDSVPPGEAAEALARTEAALEALRAGTPAAALRRAAWCGSADVEALEQRLAAAPPAGDARARLDALAGTRSADALTTALPPALDTAAALGAPGAHAWLHDLGRVRPAVAAAGALMLARGGALSVHDTDDGTRVVTIAPPSKAGSARIVLDRWTEPLPAVQAEAAAALHVDAPRARAPQSWLLAVSPDPVQPWSLSMLADVVAETVDLLPLRAVSPSAVAGHYLPAALVADDLDGEALGTLATSAIRPVLR